MDDTQVLDGQSTVDEQIAEVEAEKQFGDEAAPAAVIELPTGLSEEDAERLRQEFVARYQQQEEEPLDASAIDELSDEEAAEIGSSLEVQVPMMTIPLNGAGIRIVPGESEGDKTVLLGPIAITFALPLSEAGVRHFVKEFTGGIEIATKMPTGGLEVVQ